MLFLSFIIEIELEFETIPPEFPAADSVKDLFHDLVCLIAQRHVTVYVIIISWA